MAGKTVFKRIIGGMLGLAIAAGSASGEGKQEAPDENSLGLSLNDLLSLRLSTGSFLDLDLTNSPFSMTLIEKQQIESSGARNLSELLEIYVPGFQYMINKWNGIIWGMRGIANDRNSKFIRSIPSSSCPSTLSGTCSPSSLPSPTIT
jgi:hypothetical protein